MVQRGRRAKADPFERRRPKLKIALWVGVAITAYIYSLDGTTTWQYAVFATSSYGLHSLLGAIGVVQAVTLAVSKPVAAKVADVFGRAEAMTFVVFFYVLGYASEQERRIRAPNYADPDCRSRRWIEQHSHLRCRRYSVRGRIRQSSDHAADHHRRCHLAPMEVSRFVLRVPSLLH